MSNGRSAEDNGRGATDTRVMSADKSPCATDRWLMSTDRSLQSVAATPSSADQGEGLTGSPSREHSQAKGTGDPESRSQPRA
jgi:hypothetical protein